jgi:hypothetical protein
MKGWLSRFDACQPNQARFVEPDPRKIAEAFRKLADTGAREDQGVTLAICIIVATLAGFVAGWSLRSHYIIRATASWVEPLPLEMVLLQS